MRIVFDTNTFISAILWTGAPQKSVTAAIDRQDTILSSEAMLIELKNVIFRSKFEQRFIIAQTTPQAALDELLETLEFVEPADVPSNVIRDAKDQMVLACAVGGRADYIVSGDKDLLVLGSYEGIPILTADQFLERLSSD